MFDFNAYFSRIVQGNRLARQNGFRFGTCTGIEGMESVISSWNNTHSFILSDDVTTGETYQNAGGWFQRRTYTVFILRKAHLGKEKGRQRSLDICRELMRQLQSRLLRDQYPLSSEFTYLRLDNMPATEISQFTLSGVTGVYFMVSVDEPLNLLYDEKEWDD